MMHLIHNGILDQGFPTEHQEEVTEEEAVMAVVEAAAEGEDPQEQ